MTEARLLRTVCEQSSCPQFKFCAKAPTEVFSNTNTVDYLIVGESMGRSEAQHPGRPFHGKAGQVLRYALSKTLPKGATYALTNTVRTHTRTQTDSKLDEAQSRLPIQREIDLCSHHLWRDIKILQPKNIVALGAIPYKVLGGVLPHKTMRGKSFWARTAGDIRIKTHVLLHPAKVVFSPDLISVLMDDLEGAFGYRDDLQIKSAYKTKIIEDPERIGKFVTHLLTNEDYKMVSFDTETTNGLSIYGNNFATLQFCPDGETGYVIPYAHRDVGYKPKQLSEVKGHLHRLFLEKPKFSYWAGWNSKFDVKMTRQFLGVWVRNRPILDGMSAWFLLDENRNAKSVKGFLGGTYSLKMAAAYFGFDGYSKSILKVRNEGNLGKVPLADLASYGAADVYVTWHALQNFFKMGDRQEFGYARKMKTHLSTMFDPAYRFMAMAERNGMLLDQDKAEVLTGPESPLLVRIKEIEDEMQTMPNVKRAMAELAMLRGTSSVTTEGKTIRPLFAEQAASHMRFEVGSGDARMVLFFKTLGLEPLKRGKKSKLFKDGTPSIDKEFIARYEKEVPEVALVAEHRKIKFMMNTFISKMAAMVNPDSEYFDPTSKDYNPDGTDGKVHPNNGLTFTVTGRSNQWAPSLQQIPRKEKGDKATTGQLMVQKAVKDLFYAKPGRIIVQIDYKVSEVRWLGILAQCKGLAKNFGLALQYYKDFLKNPTPENLKKSELYGDIHKVNSSLAYGVPVDEVTSDMRQGTKSAVTFGGIYGASEKSIAAQIKNTVEFVRAMMAKIWGAMPDSKEYLDRCVKLAQTQGYVENAFFQRRRVPALKVYEILDDGYGVSHTANQSRNAPIQNASSSNALTACGLLADYVIDNKLEDKWLLENAVHDSLIADLPFDKEEVRRYIEVAEDIFTRQVVERLEARYDMKFNLPLGIDVELGFAWGSLKSLDGSKPNFDAVWAKLEEEHNKQPKVA